MPVFSFRGNSAGNQSEGLLQTREGGGAAAQMGYWGWPAGLGFRLRAFAAVLNPGLGNGRTLRSPTGEIGLSEIQIVFVKVSICPETMKLHQRSLRETHFEATVARFDISLKFSRKSK